MGFFKNLFRTAGNIFGGTIGSIPGLAPIGNAITTSIGQAEARDQLKSEQNFSAQQADLNRQFQREERELTQQWELEQWQREMDYNSPANQIKLAMEAGINPNSIVGAGGNFSPTSAPSSSPMSGSMASSPGSIASSLLMLDPQTANLMANTRKTEAETEGIEIANSFAPKFNAKALQKAQAEIDELGARKGFTDEQTKQIKEMLPLLKDKNEQEIEQIKQQTKVLIEQAREAKAKADSAEFEANQAKWANDFRELYGVTPNSGLVDGIIQLIASGDKGANIADALLETLCNVAIGTFTGIGARAVKGYNWLTNLINSDQPDPPVVQPM